MLVIKNPQDLQSKSQEVKIQGKSIALVPTMGALHSGHLALVKKAKELADIVVVSIFVNKSQFNNPDDYTNYPRQDENDIEKLQDLEIDYVFLPELEEMNQISCEEIKIPNNLIDCLCGQTRPGHFEGVVEIITKLFNLINPEFSIFGQKDFQQLLVIDYLSRQLDYKTQVIGHESIREDDNLVLSSRNLRLNNQERENAKNIYKSLAAIKNDLILGENVTQAIDKQTQILQDCSGKIDYLEVRDCLNLELVKNFNPKNQSRIFIAIFFGKVRLIDNILI